MNPFLADDPDDDNDGVLDEDEDDEDTDDDGIPDDEDTDDDNDGVPDDSESEESFLANVKDRLSSHTGFGKSLIPRLSDSASTRDWGRVNATLEVNFSRTLHNEFSLSCDSTLMLQRTPTMTMTVYSTRTRTTMSTTRCKRVHRLSLHRSNDKYESFPIQ